MRFFLYENQQVARHTIMLSGITLAAHRELHTFCHSGRNLHRHYLFAIYDTVAATLFTLVLDDLTFTVTSRTSGAGLHRTQNRLLVTDHRTATLTGRTSLRTAVAFGPRAMTVITRHIFFQFEFLFYSCRDFFQSHLYLDT